MEHTLKAPMDTGISTEARGVINPTTGFALKYILPHANGILQPMR